MRPAVIVMLDALKQPWEYWKAGGPLMVPIGVVCFGIWCYYLRSRRALLNAISDTVGFEEHLADRPADAAPYELRRWLSTLNGLLPGTVTEALDAARNGRPVGPSFDAAEEHRTAGLKRDLVVLSALTAAAPLLGLLGTVVGMIQTFQAVASSGGDTGRRVATGISQALITTQMGLIVAIPGVFGVARLNRLLDQTQMRFSICKTYLLMGLAAGAQPNAKPARSV
jgi:biopolymer transport protein ExbB